MADSPILALLRDWDNYYVIVGSSAAALTGLQFVVIALVAEIVHRNVTPVWDAFNTPTVVHFTAALLVSASLSAPWRAVTAPTIAFSVVGVFGVVYTAIVLKHTA